MSKKQKEHLNRLAEKRKGTHLSEKTKKKIGRANKGRELSEEHKKKISQALKGTKKPPRTSGWKGGRHKDSDGYVLIYKPEHPFSTKQGYVLEHRLVMEEYLGRYLKREEEIHHINGIRDDNRIENLKLFSCKGKHIALHNHERFK